MANIFKIDRTTNTIILGTAATIINLLGTFYKLSEEAAGLNVLRVTGLQTDATAMTGTLRGAYIDVSNGSLAATGTIRGMELKARTEAPGDTGNDVNVLEGLSISVDSKAHSVTTMRAAEFILDGKTGGTIGEAVGLRIANNLQADKATTSYGLQIYRDSFDYTADISLSLGGYITGDCYATQDYRTTASPTFSYMNITDETNGYQIDGIRNLSFISASLNLFVGPSGNFTMTGCYNVVAGDHTFISNTTGHTNSAVGAYALYENTTGFSNSVLGNASLYNNTTGYQNIAVGCFAGREVTTGNNNVFIGYSAGRNQTTNNNLLIIDNQDRTNIATELSNAILYGIMAAAPADQTLRINAVCNVTENIQIDGTQVISNRVIDARCDDAINSGDATTDGVIDALRDAMITHGLIAAA